MVYFNFIRVVFACICLSLALFSLLKVLTKCMFYQGTKSTGKKNVHVVPGRFIVYSSKISVDTLRFCPLKIYTWPPIVLGFTQISDLISYHGQEVDRTFPPSECPPGDVIEV